MSKITFQFWIVILITAKSHTRGGLYDWLCVTTQEHVYFTAVTCSKLLARQHKLTARTVSDKNTEKYTNIR